MSEVLPGEGEDQWSQVPDNNYILKAFDQRRKVVKEVIFGDDISKQDKSHSLHSLGPQDKQHDSSNSIQNKNSQKVSEDDSEQQRNDNEVQNNEAQKRQVEEEIERKNMLQKMNQEYQRQQQGQQQESNSSGLSKLDYNQKSPSEKRVEEQAKLPSIANQQQKQVEQKLEAEEEKNQPQRQIQFLKTKLQRLSIFNQGHIHPIIKAVSENNKIIQMTQKRLEDQNTLLSQFKEQTSKRLEENIKNTLKQKMNEMNRENARELKDIKNMSLTIQELLQKYSTKMDKIQKNIDELIKNNQKK